MHVLFERVEIEKKGDRREERPFVTAFRDVWAMRLCDDQYVTIT
jgi:hypothetical protein